MRFEILSGPAGAGKTSSVMASIAERVRQGKGSTLMIVPEQYSFEAERELARVAGDRLSLYGELMSFRTLARRVEAETGGRRMYLDAGGRLLCMSLALESVDGRLSVYNTARRSAEMKKMLLDAVEMLNTAGLGEKELIDTAGGFSDSLSDKLRDLALISAAYKAVVGTSKAEPSDRLSILAENLERSEIGREGHIYIDGFTDFTEQEHKVLTALMGKGADITLCLTIDNEAKDSEVFSLSRRTATRMIQDAQSRGMTVVGSYVQAEQRTVAAQYADRLFTYGGERRSAQGAIRLRRVGGIAEECEFAASEVLRLVREKSCRYSDISVAIRGFSDYAAELEATFSYYGVPLYTASKTAICTKPLPSAVESAYEIIGGGWELGDVFAYLRTGLGNISEDDCDILENYCITWNIGAAQWLTHRDWGMHPDGYGVARDEKTEAALKHINELRREVSEPLLALSRASGAARTAKEQAEALVAFMTQTRMASILSDTADKLHKMGRTREAAESKQVWDVFTQALEQFVAIASDLVMDSNEFIRLLILMLSQYELGTIPISPDCVMAGDMDRMRRRHIKELIILGASEERVPSPRVRGGVFSEDERRVLTEQGLVLDAGDAELWREFSLIYNCVSLPSQGLTIVVPSSDAGGAPTRASMLVTRARSIFDVELESVDMRLCKARSKYAAAELAACEFCGESDELTRAAHGILRVNQTLRMERLESASKLIRGRLSRSVARELYGDNPKLSASRADKFSGCRFSFFLQYGLRAKARRAAEFSPPEFGTFMHYVLEKVARVVTAEGGFKKVTLERLHEISDMCTEQYIKEELEDFRDKSARFTYLFRRLGASVRRIVEDMATELCDSDFEPLEFEYVLPRTENMALGGVVDRVDAWVKGDRLYIRVIDYKTGRKSFSLTDVLNGMGMQMLIYLFSLGERGKALWGKTVVPAGVLYVPTRDDLISANYELSDEELLKQREKNLRRSGLLLDGGADLLYAMEKSETPRRIPIKWKDGKPSGDALASAEQLGLLSKHVNNLLSGMAAEIKGGSISADPYYKGVQENACQYCEYVDACRFTENGGEDRRRYMKKLPASKVWNMLEGGERRG